MKVNSKMLDIVLAKRWLSLTSLRGRGLSPQTSTKIQKGENDLFITIDRFAEALGVDVTDFIEQEGWPIQETIILKNKRFVPMVEYQRISGLSYATVNHLCKTGQLSFITTESGQRRIDTQERNTDGTAILERLNTQEKMLRTLCKQFNTAVTVWTQ